MIDIAKNEYNYKERINNILCHYIVSETKKEKYDSNVIQRLIDLILIEVAETFRECNKNLNEIILKDIKFWDVELNNLQFKHGLFQNCNFHKVSFKKCKFNQAILDNCRIWINNSNNLTLIFDKVKFKFFTIIVEDSIDELSFINCKLENSDIYDDRINEIIYDNTEIINTEIGYSMKYAEDNDVNFRVKFYKNIKLENVWFVGYEKAGIESVADIEEILEKAKILKEANVEYTNIFINKEDFESIVPKYGYQEPEEDKNS
ncbi:MAG: pentapeptide repeat-containing protein [Alphaproteobacteria bacterium]|nr:pentapeptide repeat-containing protein [Alphaproteobacteria bacterium]